jgi:hypothetical protein
MLPLPNGVPSKRPAKAQLKSAARLVADFINAIGQKATLVGDSEISG